MPLPLSSWALPSSAQYMTISSPGSGPAMSMIRWISRSGALNGIMILIDPETGCGASSRNDP